MSKLKIEYSSFFIKQQRKFVKNNRERFNDFAKTVRLFLKNPTHPSLNLEKLKHSCVWSIRLNKGDRIFFIWKSKTTAIFIDIDKHDKYKKY